MITTANRLTLSSKSDKVEMARAIYDSVMEKIHADKVASAKAVYDSVVSMLPGELSKSLEPQLKGMTSALVNGISTSEANVRAMLKSFDERLEQVKAEGERREKELREHYEAKMEDMLSKQWQQLSAMLKGLPMPSVNIPENAISIKQEPSVVNVVNQIPEQPASVVNVVNQVPEQKAPVVSVVNQVPEQKPPDVHVNVPSTKPMEKSIAYDDFGRPSIITEREAK